MENQCCAVTKLLNDKHNVKVPDDWVQSCVEWVYQENQEASRMPINRLYSKVYEQWLLTNLTDLGISILPDDDNQPSSTQLSGFFCLQVNAIIDISQPFFQQIIKRKGHANDNVEVTEETQSKQNSNSSRMLLMELTDGCRIVKGLEYKPIPALSTDMAPGVKIAVNGPVECRRNTLLLRKENVHVLGGMVDQIAEQNKQDKLLLMALGTDSLDEDLLRCWYRQPNSMHQLPALRRPNSDRRNTPTASSVNRTTTSNSSNKQKTSLKSYVSSRESSDQINDEMDSDLLDELCAAMVEDF